MNEAIFREIAEAYEILSSKSLKEKYDNKRKHYLESNRQRSGGSGHQQNSHRNFDPSNHPYPNTFDHNMMDDMFQQIFEEADSHRNNFYPSLIGPIVSSGHVCVNIYFN